MRSPLGSRVPLRALATAALAAVVVASFGAVANATYTKVDSDKWAGGSPYTYRHELGENQPWVHSYTPESILGWSPQTDPDAEFNRARIPLQPRIEQNVKTQANKQLTSEANVLVLAGDYQNENDDMWNAGYLTQYNNYFSRYLFNYWQYVDYYGTWHGELTQDVPPGVLGISDNAIMKSFEHGLLMLPNPAYTNAAHKNGAKSIAVIAPEPTKKGQLYTVLLQQDANGGYPVARKLVEMKDYYGFDGYFINEEDTRIAIGDVSRYKEFMKYLRDHGCYVQWYDAISNSTGGRSYQNMFNSENSPFVKDSKLGQVSDSIFLNYWWFDKSNVTTSVAQAKSLGLNPLDTVYFGIEGGAIRWNQYMGDIANLKDGQGNALTSLAIIGSDMPNDVGKDTTGVYRDKYKNENQWKVFERERIWWSGPRQDPTATGRTNLTRNDLGIRGSNWDGVASLIPGKSAIRGNTFYTNFNTGHGLKYYMDGKISNSYEWNNINIQDILPTWQWWIDTDGTKLQADFDYGTGYDHGTVQKYTTVDPYRGGSSLVVSGKLDARNFLRLYKSDLNVKANTKASLTFKKTSDDNASMKLGLIFEGAEDAPVTIDLKGTTAKSDHWTTVTADLAKDAGKHIAAFGLVFDGTSDQYQMNIGEMKISNGNAKKPTTPTGLRINKAYSTGDMTVSWDMADYGAVKQYNIYATVNGTKMYMGGTYDSVFYIKDLHNPKGKVTIELAAVGSDGSESRAAAVTYDYGSGLPQVAVVSNDGQLNVDCGQGVSNVTVTTEDESKPRAWTTSCVDGKAAVRVPKGPGADGARYTMTLTLRDGRVVTYDGRLDDSYSAPYSGKFVGTTLSYPTVRGWYKLHYQEVMDRTAGIVGPQKTMTIYADYIPSITQTSDGMYVIVEDYDGNLSQKAFVPNSAAFETVAVALDPSNAEVAVGHTQRFTAQVDVRDRKTGAPLEADTAGVIDLTRQVSWSVDGAKSPDTTIDSEGTLTVGSNETAKSLTVRATSTMDPSKNGSAAVTVTPAPWAQDTVYLAGNEVVYNGSVYRATWWTRGQTPGDPWGPWQEIVTAPNGDAMWTASRIFDTGDVVLYENARYQAKWWTRNQVPGDPSGPWELIG